MNARHAGVGDSVEIQYVVDADGTARVDLARVIRGRCADVVKAAVSVLPKWRFEPARVGTCAVPVLVQELFVFEMRR